MHRRHWLAATALAGLPVSSLTRAQTDDFPSRPVRILMPFAAGGAPDVIARLVSQQLSKLWNQSVVVENRTGANSIVAAEAVAKSPANGYTLLFTTGSHTTNPSIYRKLPFDTQRDFVPVTQVVTTQALVLVVNPQLPIKSVADFIAAGRAGKIAYGSPGVGNTLHLPGELLNVRTGTKLLHVPYKGAAPALTAVIGGEIQAVFLTPTAALPVIKANQVRPLAVTSAARVALFPDVPSLAESGVPDFDYSGGWMGVFAPGKTPPEVVKKIADGVRQALKVPEVATRISSESSTGVGSTPEEFARFVKEDIERYAAIVRAANIPPIE